MPGLVVREGPLSGIAFNLEGKERVTLGRAPDNAVWLDDRTVSRYHAIMEKCEGSWAVQDLGSSNGMMVNGKQVGEAPLAFTDQLQLGNVLMTFVERLSDVPAGAGVVGAQDLEITQIIHLDDSRRAVLGVAFQSQMARQSRRLSAMLSLSEMAASVRSIPALMDGLVRSLRRSIGADQVIPLLEDEEGHLRAYVATRHDFIDDLTELGLDMELVRRGRDEGPVAARGGPDGTIAVACVPIRVGSTRLGVLYFSATESSVEFNAEDLRYLFGIGVAAGLIMEKIRSDDRMVLRARNLARQIEERYDMVGESEPMQKVYRFISKVAPTDAGVLICGESGAGKEMVARAIHRYSLRSDGPLEVVNCGAVPEGLLESELFGHVRGAFTGAVAERLGRFELADGGTLFLDEVVELPPHCQTKLLRILEEKKVRRVGDTKDRTVDVRLIAATNRRPQQAVTAGLLREDLYYRLDRLRIVVPPLRERRDDIAVLAAHFLAEFGRASARHVEGFAPAIQDIFASYDWPGNVRELKNVVERMVILADGPVLGADLVPEDLRAASAGPAQDTAESLDEIERRHILQTFERAGGNKKKAAAMLDIDRSTLYAKLKRYDIGQ